MRPRGQTHPYPSPNRSTPDLHPPRDRSYSCHQLNLFSREHGPCCGVGDVGRTCGTLGAGDVGPGSQMPRKTQSDSQGLPMACHKGSPHPTTSPPLFLLLLATPVLVACLSPTSVLSSALPAGHGSLQLIWTAPPVWHVANKHLRVDET